MGGKKAPSCGQWIKTVRAYREPSSLKYLFTHLLLLLSCWQVQLPAGLGAGEQRWSLGLVPWGKLLCSPPGGRWGKGDNTRGSYGLSMVSWVHRTTVLGHGTSQGVRHVWASFCRDQVMDVWDTSNNRGANTNMCPCGSLQLLKQRQEQFSHALLAKGHMLLGPLSFWFRIMHQDISACTDIASLWNNLGGISLWLSPNV